MSFLSRPKHLVAATARRLDGAAVAVGRVGVGSFGWPLVIGMGLGVGLFGLWQPKFAQAWLSHRATLDYMRPVLKATAAAVLVTIAAALGFAVMRRRKGAAPSFLESYVGVLRRGAFLASLPLVVLLVTHPVPDREWFVLTLIVLTSVLVAYSLYQFFAVAAPPRAVGRASHAVAFAVVVVGALSYAFQTARLGIANHLRFNTGRADLGLYVSLFRESSQGRLLGCSLCGSGQHPYSHFEPIVALLAPLYLLHPAAQTLIVLGGLVVASGAIPLYLFARRKLGEAPAVALALAYLAYPPLSEVALFDFHAVELAIPVSLWLLYALECGAMRTYYVFAVLLLLLREDMGLVLASVGIYALAAGGQARRAVALRTLSLSIVGLVVGHFAASGGVSGVFGDLVSTFTVGPRRALRPATIPELPMALARRLLSEAKALHLAELLVPLFVLPLFGPGRVLLLYGGALTFLAAVPYSGTKDAYEAALVVPFLFVLTVNALGRAMQGELAPARGSGEAFGKALAFGVFSACVLAGVSLGPFGKSEVFRVGPRVLERQPTSAQISLDSELQKLARSWPRGAKVAASNAVLPHLGRASHLYTLDDRAQSDYVVASMKQRQIAHRLESEESSKELERVGVVGDVRFFRARYTRPLSPKARQLDDE
jgi:uncharacterized membrane protein